jgi:hypothetical protein
LNYIYVVSDILPDAMFTANTTSIIQGQSVAFTHTGSNGKHAGIWIGEYGYAGSTIVRQNIVFDRNASLLSKQITDYAARKLSEKNILKKKLLPDEMVEIENTI